MAVPIASVVAIVLIQRRSLRPLLGLRLRWLWLIWLAALVQFVRYLFVLAHRRLKRAAIVFGGHSRNFIHYV